MGRMSHETRLRVIGLWKLKYRLKDIQAKLQEELYCLFSVYYDMYM